MLQINHDTHHKLWCGPAAIAAVTGLPTSTIYQVIREHRLAGGGGKRSGEGIIGWMLVSEVLHALDALGVSCKSNRPRGTLKRFLSENRDGTYIILAGKHFIAVENGNWTDQYTRNPAPISEIKRPKCRVHTAILVRC